MLSSYLTPIAMMARQSWKAKFNAKAQKASAAADEAEKVLAKAVADAEERAGIRTLLQSRFFFESVVIHRVVEP